MERNAEDPVQGCLGLFAVMLAIAIVMFPSPSAGQAGIMGTKHNLSSSGPGPIKALGETQVCLFCHTPHNANPLGVPLWNREFSVANYTPYDSPSIQAIIGQPTGYSKLCLSCHDGTIAIGAVRNLGGRPATVTGLESPLQAGSTLIGTVLTNDHPVSFVFDQLVRIQDGELADPDSLTGPVRLKPGTNPLVANNVQCSTCHDPHEARLSKFLRKSATGQSDNLCLTCHVKPGWVGSTHESDTFFYPKNQAATQVRDHSCFACHTPHTVLGAERLLRNAAIGGVSAIEETCYICHQPGASGGIVMDIKTEFGKIWHHPVTLSPGTHRPIFLSSSPLPENIQLSPGSPSPDGRFTDTKHVECVDCHNPHKVKKSNRTEGMRGIALDGAIVASVINDPNPADGQPSQVQYPICLRCHGDTFSTVVGVATLPSGATPSNKRTEFQTANSAFHPVGGPGRNTSSNLNAQLTPNGLNTSSVIKCTDCHNSNSYESTSGRVPNTGTTVSTPVGPHGSVYPSIRRARYENTLPGPSAWNPSNFNLCFRCHDVTKLTSRRFNEGAQTNFDDEGENVGPPLANGKGRNNLHWFHLIDKIDGSRPLCKSCHYNIHSNVEAPNTQYRINGVVLPLPPTGTGTPTRLVNFHPNIRPIGGRPKPEWEFNTTTKERRCWLQCHRDDGSPGGVTMSGFSYRPPSGDLP